MAIIKSKDILKMNEKEISEKIEELRVELLKSKATGKKTGKSNNQEIKRTIARLLTIRRAKEIGGKK